MASLFEELGTACLAPTPDAPLGFTKCGRCRGTGIYSENVRRVHVGVPGGCLQCNMEGRFRIPTPEEIAQAKAERVALKYRADAIMTIKNAVNSNSDIRVIVHVGLDRLECTAPDRFAKLLRSVAAGRLNEVIAALVAYETAERKAEREAERASG